MRSAFACLLAAGLAGCGTSEPETPKVRSVAYSCEAGLAFTALFNSETRIATLIGLTELAILLPEREAESGFRYASATVEFRGEGEQASITDATGRTAQCRVVGTGTGTGGAGGTPG